MVEWDWPQEPRRQRRRRPPPILEGEILEPEQESRVHRVTIEHVHHQRRSASPQRIVVIAALCVLALIMLRSPGGLLMLAVIVPPIVWKTIATMVAIVAFVAWRQRCAGRPF